MKPEVWVPVAIAAGSGLAFLSYRHRAFYHSVDMTVSFALMAFLLFALTWNIATDNMYRGVLHLVTVDNFADLDRAHDGALYPTGYVLVGSLVAWAFLRFLAIMPEEAERGRHHDHKEAPPAKTSPAPAERNRDTT
jgi:hypothetical protein